jgi:hypothetical protein
VKISVVALCFEMCTAKIPPRKVARVRNQKWFVLSYYFCRFGSRHLRGTYLFMISLCERVTNDILVMWNENMPVNNTLYVTVIIPLKSFRQCSALSDSVFVKFWYLIVQSGTETGF